MADFPPVADANWRPPAENDLRPPDDSIARQSQEQEETVLYFPDYVDGGG